MVFIRRGEARRLLKWLRQLRARLLKSVNHEPTFMHRDLSRPSRRILDLRTSASTNPAIQTSRNAKYSPKHARNSEYARGVSRPRYGQGYRQI